MDDIIQIDSHFIEEHNDFRLLVSALKEAFSSKDLLSPMRHHHDFPNPEVGPDSTLLLMPAWKPNQYAGVKVVTVSPSNAEIGLPSIQGVYLYLDAKTGSIKAILDAKNLTVKRTAAASALASSYLSRKDSSSLLMLGTGALSPNLIKAHAAVRPIEEVFVWGRSYEKAKGICQELKNEDYKLSPVKHLKDKIGEVDIVSAATMSPTPLVLGEYLRPGQHVDLVGAYKKDMREADDEAVKKASVFVDTFEGGLKESGDIVIPLDTGVLRETDIRADFFGLCTNTHRGRDSREEITLFKSVGHALEDVAGANYFYEEFIQQK